MQFFLVGGAVRDALLGLPVTDRDWVVVGATPEQMLAAGFRPVGRDFPVFLHPHTHEEYALARTERKQGHGYKGFVICADPDVTLEEDLLRRDLTINAMARTPEGVLIDPFGGQQAIAARRLSAVSPAFAEDPLRVLRTARFAARFHALGFQVDEATLDMMRALAQPQELHALAAERVWQEVDKALGTDYPQVFFQVLDRCEALAVLWPELAECWQMQAEQLEIRLRRAVAAGLGRDARFALLFLDLPEQQALALLQRFRCPGQSALLVQQLLRVRRHPGLQAKSPENVLQLLEQLDAWRKPQQAVQLLKLLQCLSLTCQTADWSGWIERLAALKVADLGDVQLTGKALGQALRDLRLDQLSALLAL